MIRLARLLILLSLLLPGATSALHAQTTSDMATIEGSVTDPDGKAIVNAAIVVRNTLSGDVRATVSDGAGRFVVDLLIVGSYEVEASAPGFATMRRSGVQISAGKPINVAFSLPVGQLSEQIRTIDTSTSAPAQAWRCQSSYGPVA